MFFTLCFYHVIYSMYMIAMNKYYLLTYIIYTEHLSGCLLGSTKVSLGVSVVATVVLSVKTPLGASVRASVRDLLGCLLSHLSGHLSI